MSKNEKVKNKVIDCINIKKTIKDNLKTDKTITGLFTLLLFCVIKVKLNIQSLYIYGFSENKLKDGNIQEYYYTDYTKNERKVAVHNTHDWDLQMEIINYLKTINVIN